MALEQALVPAPSPQGAQQSWTAAIQSLDELLHARAEVFASPSTSYATGDGKQIHQETLKATKRLFDASLQAEPEALKLFSKLLSEIRDADHSPKIETRSKAARRQNADVKGKGKASASSSNWLSNPLFRPTPLQELYIDGIDTSSHGNSESASQVPSSSSKSAVNAELELQMLWEQLEQRNEKVLQIVKEIVHDGDDVDDDDVNGEGYDDDDSEEDDDDEDEFGLEGEDDDTMLDNLDEDDEDEEEGDSDQELYDGTDSEEGNEDEMEEDDMSDEDGGSPVRKLAGPYYAKLRDASPASDASPVAKKGVKKGSKQKDPSAVKPESEADDGLFSLKDFNQQVLAGEDEMKRYISSGRSKSINDLKTGLDGLEDLDDSDNEEIDYFAPVDGAGDDAGLDPEDDDDDEEDGEDEEEEEEGGMRPEDMRYSDFWQAPSKVYTKRRDDDYAPGGKGKNFKGKGGKHQKPESKARQWGASATSEATADSAGDKEGKNPEGPNNGKKDKRKVSFHDQVKVQEIEPIKGPQSAFSQLVKAVGVKEAMRRLKEGEFQEDWAEAVDGGENDEYDDEGEDMTEEEMKALLDGEYGSSDEEDQEGSGDDEEEDDDEDDDGESQASDESVHQGAMTMRRLQKDLLSDDTDNTSVTKKKKGQQSRYEARMAALSEQISALEAENVAEREWTMRGEVNARTRPQNSLLEEDLEFDQAAKVVPVVTEESSLSLEDMIKKRILEDRFDDVVRKSAVEAAAYIPSRILDIKDTQSERSLADIYADEFSAERRRANGEEAETPEIDSKLAKEHESIRGIFDDICNKLDALSNAHFTPQAAQTTITTISNAPSISMESAMPAAMSAASGLAPEEVYAPDQKGTLTARSEMTPSQKKAARAKARKARMQTQKVMDKYGGKSRNDKQAKERAMNSLIGKRGVTVVGKGKAAKSALTGKDRRERGAGPDTSGMSGAKFKL